MQPGALVLTSYVPAGTLHVSVGAPLDDRVLCCCCQVLCFDVSVDPVVRSSPNLLIGSASTLQFEATLWQP